MCAANIRLLIHCNNDCENDFTISPSVNNRKSTVSHQTVGIMWSTMLLNSPCVIMCRLCEYKWVDTEQHIDYWATHWLISEMVDRIDSVTSACQQNTVDHFTQQSMCHKVSPSVNTSKLGNTDSLMRLHRQRHIRLSAECGRPFHWVVDVSRRVLVPWCVARTRVLPTLDVSAVAMTGGC